MLNRALILSDEASLIDDAGFEARVYLLSEPSVFFFLPPSAPFRSFGN